MITEKETSEQAKVQQMGQNGQLKDEAKPVGRPRVVIVGAGFGGLNAMRKLADTEVDVLVLDRNNYHGFWPLLYEVATAGLEPEAIGYPVRAIVGRYQNVSFQMTEVHSVDFKRKLVYTDSLRDPVPYEYLILSAGSADNYFGNNELAKKTFRLKDIDDAARLRNHILSVFELAAREPDPEYRAMLLTFVIVGGGPTGVELAGSFTELFLHVMRRDYPEINVKEARVVLVEGMNGLLINFDPVLQKKAKEQLEQMGAEVRLNTLVTDIEDDCVLFKDGTKLPARTVIWAAGVRASLLADNLEVPLARASRIPVTPYLTQEECPGVFVIGDMAHLEGFKGNKPFPMVAPVAIQQGQLAAKNILAQIRKQPMEKFNYADNGSMATIGRRAAVVEAFGLKLSGFAAWISWLFVHLIMLIGFRNRLVVLTNWAYNYFTYDRGARIIIRPERDVPPKTLWCRPRKLR